LKERQLRPIPHRIAIRVERRGKQEPHDRRYPRGQIDRQRARVAEFRPLEAISADPHPSGDLAKTKGAMHPCVGEFAGNALPKKRASPRAACCDALTPRHAGRMDRDDCPSLI
jgi:hypothetical protein